MNNEAVNALKIIRQHFNKYRQNNNICLTEIKLSLDYSYIENQLDKVYSKDCKLDFIYKNQESRINKLFENALRFFKSAPNEFYKEKEEIIDILISAIEIYDSFIINNS